MMTVIVSTRAKMSKRMNEALSIFEAVGIVTGKKFTTEDEVRAYLREKHGDKMAEMFRPEFMFSTPEIEERRQ